MKQVVPTVRQGGVSVALVMVSSFPDDAHIQPNLTPPVTTTEMALKYKERLERLEPKVKFLMTLYLSPEITVEEVEKAKKAGIVGTLNSSAYLTSRRQILSKATPPWLCVSNSTEG